MDFELSTVERPLDVDLPPGFDAGILAKKSPVRGPSSAQLADLKVKRAWDVALAPAKSLPMSLIMSYMTGNSLQIIPIMMTFSLLINPLKAIFSETNVAFKPLTVPENESTILVIKVVFVLCQLASAGVGVYKLNAMGLIPNRESDWLAWELVVVPKEWAGVF